MKRVLLATVLAAAALSANADGIWYVKYSGTANDYSIAAFEDRKDCVEYLDRKAAEIKEKGIPVSYDRGAARITTSPPPSLFPSYACLPVGLK